MGFIEKNCLGIFPPRRYALPLPRLPLPAKRKRAVTQKRGKEPEKNDNGYVSRVRSEAEHPYVERNGEPYLMLALQRAA